MTTRFSGGRYIASLSGTRCIPKKLFALAHKLKETASARFIIRNDNGNRKKKENFRWNKLTKLKKVSS